jgi:hypothetical protein
MANHNSPRYLLEDFDAQMMGAHGPERTVLDQGGIPKTIFG